MLLITWKRMMFTPASSWNSGRGSPCEASIPPPLRPTPPPARHLTSKEKGSSLEDWVLSHSNPSHPNLLGDLRLHRPIWTRVSLAPYRKDNLSTHRPRPPHPHSFIHSLTRSALTDILTHSLVPESSLPIMCEVFTHTSLFMHS